MGLLLIACLLLSLQYAATNILNLPEGQACTALGGGVGTCKLVKKCKEVGDFKHNQPPICSFKGFEPVICCPKVVSERLRVGLKVTQYCKRISKETCPSDQRRTIRQVLTNNSNTTLSSGNSTIGNGTRPIITRHYVFNGRASLPRTQNHMALIGYGPSQQKEWGCGGSLITSKYILSAAHCAKPPLLGEARWARLGDLDISTDTDDAKIQEREIVERIIHPGYKEPEVYNDIALFRLERGVRFTSWVAPICLHTERKIPSNSAVVTGWGRVAFAEETSSKLLEAELSIFNDTECRTLLPFKDKKTPRGIDSDLMFCAGKLDGSKDACSGDSGGPLAIALPDQCLKTQVGITSYGSQCGLPNSPGVYTRVSTYIEWIEKVAFLNTTTSS